MKIAARLNSLVSVVPVFALSFVLALPTEAGESGFLSALTSDGRPGTMPVLDPITNDSTGLPLSSGWSEAEADRLLVHALQLREYGSSTESVLYLERALEAYRRSLGPDAGQQLRALVPLLDHHLQTAEWDRLDDTLNEIMRVYSRHYEPTHPVYIHVLQERAFWHLLMHASGQAEDRQAELQAAYQLYADALRLSSAYYGDSAANLGELLENMAAVAYLFSDSVRHPETGSGTIVRNRAGTRLDTARDYEGMHMGYQQGKRALEGLVELYSQAESQDPGGLIEARILLADWHQSFGFHQQARRLYRQAEVDAQLVDGLNATDILRYSSVPPEFDLLSNVDQRLEAALKR